MKQSFVDASGLNVEEAKALFASSVKFRNALNKVLERKYAERVKSSFSKKNFDKPSWNVEQAYNLGYLAALDELLSDFLDS